MSPGEKHKSFSKFLLKKFPSGSKQDLKMKRKTMSVLILNLSYGATEKLIFPGRVITAAKNGPFASKFERVKTHEGLRVAHLPATQLFAQNTSSLQFCVTSHKKCILEEVS